MHLLTVAGAAHVGSDLQRWQAFAPCFPFNCEPRTAREHQNEASVEDDLPLRQRKSEVSPVVFEPASVMHYTARPQDIIDFKLAGDLMRDPIPTATDTLASKVDYYSRQYNARAEIPDHPQLFTRWQNESALVRRTHAGLLDIPFGSAIGERLDFFPAPRPGAPLLVFIHGGWWRSLDKSDFTFIVPGYHAAGFNVALTNYTLAPEASIEQITQQQLRAFAWLYKNAARYEYDPERIVVAGHSAGAHLAAMMMAALWNTYDAELPASLIKAGILMSGLYDLDPVRYAEFVNVDLKITEHNALQLSPGYMPQSHPIPFITSVGDLESAEFKRQTALIASQWQAAHKAEIALHGINHLTICDMFANREHPLFEQSCKLIANS